MPDVLIRNVPEHIHEELRRRADAAAMSLQSYVMKLLHEEAALPSLTDWLDEVRALSPVRPTMTGAEAVAAGRADVDDRP